MFRLLISGILPNRVAATQRPDFPTELRPRRTLNVRFRQELTEHPSTRIRLSDFNTSGLPINLISSPNLRHQPTGSTMLCGEITIIGQRHPRRFPA